MSTPSPQSFAQVLGLRPELLADYQRFADRFWADRLIDPVLLELCRLRVADMLGCSSEMQRRTPEAVAAGLREEQVAALAEWRTSSLVSATERACLHFTEGFVLDPHGISDADAAAVAAHLPPAEMVALVEALAVFDGFTRFRLMLGVEA